MHLGTLLIILNGFNSFFSGLFEGSVLEEDELLLQEHATLPDVVRRCILHEQEAKDLLEEADVLIRQRGDQLFQLDPSDALPGDQDVAQELVELVSTGLH